MTNLNLVLVYARFKKIVITEHIDGSRFHTVAMCLI